jgi:VanZ family protein
MRRIGYWGPVLAWAALIWYFSTETFAAASTSRFLEPLLGWLLPWASPEWLEAAHFLLRKLGHVTEYFVLSLLLYRAIAAGRGRWRASWALGAFVAATAYAAADEVHQTFLPSRTGAAADVLLDAAGAAAALLVLRWRLRRRQARALAARAPAAQRKTPAVSATEE